MGRVKLSVLFRGARTTNLFECFAGTWSEIQAFETSHWWDLSDLQGWQTAPLDWLPEAVVAGIVVAVVVDSRELAAAAVRAVAVSVRRIVAVEQIVVYLMTVEVEYWTALPSSAYLDLSSWAEWCRSLSPPSHRYSGRWGRSPLAQSQLVPQDQL